jgi:hypothetical protein
MQTRLRGKMTEQVKGYIRQVKDRHSDDMRPLVDERATMVMAQRAERKMLKQKQEERWIAETKVRSERLNKGLRGLFDRLTGSAKKTRSQNEREAVACSKRDQDQRNHLITAQMLDCKEMQRRANQIRSKHRQDRKLLAKTINGYLGRASSNEKVRTLSHSHAPEISR